MQHAVRLLLVLLSHKVATISIKLVLLCDPVG